MKFQIERSSMPAFYSGYKASQPCEGAVLDGDEWQIEVNSLEELLEMVSEQAHIIVKPDNKLEIYDDYRE